MLPILHNPLPILYPPQVFVKGQLVGGLELTEKLIASGEMGQLCR